MSTEPVNGTAQARNLFSYAGSVALGAAAMFGLAGVLFTSQVKDAVRVEFDAKLSAITATENAARNDMLEVINDTLVRNDARVKETADALGARVGRIETIQDRVVQEVRSK